MRSWQSAASHSKPSRGGKRPSERGVDGQLAGLNPVAEEHYGLLAVPLAADPHDAVEVGVLVDRLSPPHRADGVGSGGIGEIAGPGAEAARAAAMELG